MMVDLGDKVCAGSLVYMVMKSCPPTTLREKKSSTNAA